MKGILKASPQISEEKVVEEIGKYRKGFVGKDKTIPEGSTRRKVDNVSTDEVVEIIQEMRKQEYTPYHVTTEQAKGASPKVKELQELFEDNGQQMAWERLVENVVEDFASELEMMIEKASEMVAAEARLDGMNGARVVLNEMIISKAEEHPFIKEYNNLNRRFEMRVKVENKTRDDKKAHGKRDEKSPKQKEYQKKRGVEKESDQN